MNASSLVSPNYTVIASEAKQSRATRAEAGQEALDCFVATLLAMTKCAN
jgi:hypothetical protein